MENITSSLCTHCFGPPVSPPGSISLTERAKVRIGFCGIRRVAIKEVVLKRETDYMAIRNKNIIQFYHHHGNILVMEYADLQTLAHVINDVGDRREEVAIQISNGLTYLHNLLPEPFFIHKKIRTDNILLTQNFDAKIAGFGSDDVDCSGIWMAPELKEDPTQFSRQSDIYALGMIMGQMGEGSAAYMRWMALCQRRDPKERLLTCPLFQAPPGDLEKRETEERLDTLKRMADEGNSDVANHLGYMYMTGSKVPVNETEALKWFLLAAKDHADAQNTMGLHYYDTNPIAAEEWFLKAAKQGYRKARSNLGQLMFSQGRHDKAEEWFRKLASSGDAHAQYCLGEMYFRGWYVVQDDTEALRLFNKAAVQGHMDAEHSLGYMYQHGRGTRRDGEEAEKWYLKALEQGHIASRKHIEEMRNYKATCEWGQRAEQPIFSMDGDGKYLDMTEARLMLDELTESPPGLKEYVLHVVEEINKHYKRP